jgi:predicted kinase
MINTNLLKTLKTPFVIIMVGPPLVGKTTAIKSWLSKYDGEINVISRDAIVLEQYGSDDYSAAFNSVNQKEVDRVLISRIETANAKGQNVIIDMTNLTSKRRGYNLSFFDDEYYKVAIVFPMLTTQEFKARNEKRTIEEKKFIPDHVIRNMIDSFQPIKDKEGFNKIISL